MSSSGYKSAEKPTDAGMYQVMASYKGDSKYACVDAKYTRLFIKQKVVTVTPNASHNPIYYRDQMPEFTYTVTDEKGNTLSEEEIASLGTISVVKTPEDVTPGHYTIKAQVKIQTRIITLLVERQHLIFLQDQSQSRPWIWPSNMVMMYRMLIITSTT